MRPDQARSPGPEVESGEDRRGDSAESYGLHGRVLLVDPDPKHRRWLTRILRTIVAEVETREDLDVTNPRALEAFDVVVFNFDAVIDGNITRTDDLVWLAQRQRLLLVCSELSKHELLQRFAGLSLTNILAKNSRVDPEDMIVTLQKLMRRDIFGIEKYFIWGVTAPSLRVRGSQDRARALAWVESYVRDLNVHPRLVNALCMVSDELLTNALYDAPVNAAGARRFRDTDRSVMVDLDAGEEIVLKICCDGRRVGISVTDPFGSLQPEEILEFIERGRRKGSDQVRREEGGGAGLGLYLVYDALSHFVANLRYGQKTEMIGILDIDATYREFATRVKSFNIFVDTTDQRGDDDGAA